MAKGKKSFKSLPRKAQKAAFAQMDDDGTRRKSGLAAKSKKLPNNSVMLLERAKTKLIKANEPLIAEKKRKYSNVDISSAMSVDEKALQAKINKNFSSLNDIAAAKRKKARGENKFVGGVRKTKQ